MPVICTGGFQTASVIRKAIADGQCDAVSMARPLVANNDLVKQFAGGPRPRRAAVHLLQQVPRARRRASARLLRGEPLPEPRGDARGGDVGVSAASVRMTERLRPRFSKRLAIGGARSCGCGGRSGSVVSLASDRPTTYDDIEEHFKYGSIGSEPGGSLLSPVGGVLPPYWVFTALPSICSDKLPDGYATFGFVTEPGQDLPIGVSRRRRLGIDQVGLNCAVCHTGTVRDTPGRGAANRSRHAGAAARSAGVRAVRARLHARQPADRRRRARSPAEAAAGRRSSSARCCAPGSSIG